MKQNKLSKLGLILTIVGTISLVGCATGPNGEVYAKCENGVNYPGAVVGAIGGAAVGSLIGAGTGNVIATGAGAAVGGVAGSKSNIGCRY